MAGEQPLYHLFRRVSRGTNIWCGGGALPNFRILHRTIIDCYGLIPAGFSSTSVTNENAVGNAVDPGSDAIAMLVDSGAFANFIDSYLLPGLQRLARDCRELQPCMTITTVVNHELCGTATGVFVFRWLILMASLATSVGPTLVTGLGRHLFSEWGSSRTPYPYCVLRQQLY